MSSLVSGHVTPHCHVNTLQSGHCCTAVQSPHHLSNMSRRRSPLQGLEGSSVHSLALCVSALYPLPAGPSLPTFSSRHICRSCSTRTCSAEGVATFAGFVGRVVQSIHNRETAKWDQLLWCRACLISSRQTQQLHGCHLDVSHKLSEQEQGGLWHWVDSWPWRPCNMHLCSHPQRDKQYTGAALLVSEVAYVSIRRSS